MILDPEQPFVDKAQRLSSWGHWFTFFNILLAMAISSKFILTDSVPGSLLGYIYLLTNWVGHTAFITFIVFVLTIFPLSLIFPYPRHIRGMAAVLATTGMIFLAIDAYSYSRLGYHISGSSIEQVFVLLTKTWNNHPVRSFMWVFGIAGAIFAFELFISNFTWKRLERLREKACGRLVAGIFVFAFVCSHVIHIWADATLNYDVAKQNNMFPLSYPATAKTLLAKNGLLDKQQHRQAQFDQLALQQNLEYGYKHHALACNIQAIEQNLAILMIDEPIKPSTDKMLKGAEYVRFDKHYVPTNKEDAVFNLLFGLPSIYKNSVVAKRQLPLWYQVATDNNLSIDLDLDFSPLFAPFSFIKEQKAGGNADIVLFMGQIKQDELEPFLAKNKKTAVIIVGQATSDSTAINKAPLYIKMNGVERYMRQVTQNLGISSTIVQSWMGCDIAEQEKPILFGKNILLKQPKVLAANYTAGTIVSIKKDRIILLDDQGNDLQISASNGYKLNQPLDIPTLNDTINMLKRYSVK